MSCYWKKQIILPITFGMLFALSGCHSVGKAEPHMGFGGINIEAQIQRNDITILDTVEGESSITSILGPLIQIIDGDKLAVLGIKFFKDQYVGPVGFVWPIHYRRAYYKALAAHPEADAVFEKGFEIESSGIPILFWTEVVKFKGKAIELKADRGSGASPLSRAPTYPNDQNATQDSPPWQRLQRGLSPEQVRGILGRPNQESRGARSVIWYYPDVNSSYVAFLEGRVHSWRRASATTIKRQGSADAGYPSSNSIPHDSAKVAMASY